MAQVWETSKAEGGALLVLLALADESRDGVQCFPSIALLGRKARMSARNVQRVLDKLQAMGELEIIKTAGRGNTNDYRILAPHNLELVFELDEKVKNCHQLKGDNLSERVKSSVRKGDISGNPLYTGTVVNRIQPKTGGVDKSSKAKTQPLDLLPAYLDRELWDAYLEVRKKLKAVNSERAIKSLLKQLDAFDAQGFDCNRIIDTSIRNSWKDVYAPKDVAPRHATTVPARPVKPRPTEPEMSMEQRAAAAARAAPKIANVFRKRQVVAA